MYKIYNQDALDALKLLPDESVNCCVTSPPYFGLRDYGTAKWEGGDPNCDHKEYLGGHGEKSLKQVTNGGSQGYFYKEYCRKCSAKRIDNQIGLEKTPNEYVNKLVEIFREVRRVLKKDGTFWLNLGDSYAGYHGNKNNKIPTSATNGWTNGTNENLRTSTANRNGLKQKDLIGIPWRVAFALQADDWYLRQDIIWYKPNVMPESIKDRCTKSHEYIFLLTKSSKYYYDADSVKEQAVCSRMRGPALHRDAVNTNGNGGLSRRTPTKLRNKRSVWILNTKPYKGAHFATFPPDLITPCILAGCPEGGVVLDPFAGSGTTGEVALKNKRNVILIELNPDYIPLIEKRCGTQ